MKKITHVVTLAFVLALIGVPVVLADDMAAPDNMHNLFRGDNRPDLSSWPGKPSEHPVAASFDLNEYVNCNLGGTCTTYRCKRFVCTSDSGEENDRHSLKVTIRKALQESGIFSNLTEDEVSGPGIRLEFSHRVEVKMTGGSGMFIFSLLTIGLIPVASDIPMSVQLTVKEGDIVRGSVEAKETPRLWFGLLLRPFMLHALTPQEFSEQLPLDLCRAVIQEAREKGLFDPADAQSSSDDQEKKQE